MYAGKIELIPTSTLLQGKVFGNNFFFVLIGYLETTYHRFDDKRVYIGQLTWLLLWTFSKVLQVHLQEICLHMIAITMSWYLLVVKLSNFLYFYFSVQWVVGISNCSAAKKDATKGSGWERFEFDKDAPLDDEEIEGEAYFHINWYSGFFRREAYWSLSF